MPEDTLPDVDAAVKQFTGTDAWKNSDPEQRRGYVRKFAVKSQTLGLPDDFHNAVTDKLYGEADSNGFWKGLAHGARALVEFPVEAAIAGGMAVTDTARAAAGGETSGSGTRLKEGVKQLVDTAGQYAKQPGSNDEQEKRDRIFEFFKKDLDEKRYPESLKPYLAGQLDPNAPGYAEAQNYLNNWKDLTLTQTMKASEHNRDLSKLDPLGRTEFESHKQSGRGLWDSGKADDLIADYLTTRDPAVWHGLYSLGSETDTQWKNRLERSSQDIMTGPETEAALKEHGMPSYLAHLAGGAADIQSDPVSVALAIPLVRGAKALKAAVAGGAERTGAAIAGDILKSAGHGAGVGALLSASQDPRTPGAEVLKSAGQMAILGGAAHGVGEVVGRLLKKTEPPVDAMDSASEEVLPVNEALPVEPAPEVAPAPEPVTEPPAPGESKMDPEDHAREVASHLATNPDTHITAAALSEIAGDVPKEPTPAEEAPSITEPPPHEEVQTPAGQTQGLEEAPLAPTISNTETAQDVGGDSITIDNLTDKNKAGAPSEAPAVDASSPGPIPHEGAPESIVESSPSSGNVNNENTSPVDPLKADTGAPAVAPKTVADFKKGNQVIVARSALKHRNGQPGEVVGVLKGSGKVNVKMPDGKVPSVTPEALDKTNELSSAAVPSAPKMKPSKKEVDETPFVWTAAEASDDPTDEKGSDIAGATGGAVLHPSTAPSTPVVPIKGQAQIIRDLAKGLELPIRFGRLTTSKFAGYFKKVQNLIGAKRPNDIPTVAHEVGHKLDDAFSISSDPSIAKELHVLGDPKTPGSRSSWTKSKPASYKLGEGVGEFVRYWLTDPKEATRLAPNTEKYLENVLDANPDFGDVMRQSREDIQNWKNAPAEARLNSSIAIGGNPNKTRYGMTQVTRDLVDDLHILQVMKEDAEAKGTKIKASEDPYKSARLLRGSYGMANTFLQHGVIDFKTKEVKMGTSLEDALKPIAGRMDQFRSWIVAKRAQELHKQGRETGLDRNDVNDVAAKYDAEPAFQKAFDDVKKWNDALLQYAVDAGYVDAGQKATATTKATGAEAMREMNQDYVPFHRVFEIGAGENPAENASGIGRGLNAGKVGSTKRLTGSSRDIVDPIETMVKNAYALITASEKSNIASQIGALSEKPGMGKWVEKIATPMEAQKVVVEKIRKQLEAAGADLSMVPDDLAMTLFKASGHAPFGENIIKVNHEGKTTFYRLNNELYNVFHGLDKSDSDRLVKMLSAPAQLLRAGVTLDPAFGGANLIRDAFDSAVINRYGMLPFQAAAKGVAAFFKNPKLVAEWKASGGDNAFEPAYFDQKTLNKMIQERITKDMTPAERATVWLKSPLVLLRKISNFTEEVTRIGEYQTAYERGMKAGMSPGEARRQAAFEARDRQDFAMGGAKTKTIRHAAAFQNAGLQGNLAVARAFRDRPVRTTLQGLAYITLPTMGLMAINHKDPDYWDQPQWQRDVFWMIPYGKDDNGHTKFIRLPKPFALGTIFGALPERLMASQRGDKEAWRGIGSRFAENIPNPTPNAVLMLMEPNIGDQGYSFFRQRNIVPDSLKDLPPEYQATEQTSLTAKRVGKALGISPMKVDYFLASSTGGVGKQAVYNGIDRVISAMTGEKMTAQNTGPASRFFTAPAGINSQSVDTFYRDMEELKKKQGGAKIEEKAMEGTDHAKLAQMQRIAEMMGQLRKEARKTEDPGEKQKLYLRISELAKRGNGG